MKRKLYAILCLLIVCIYMNGCTFSLGPSSPYTDVYEQYDTRWNAKEWDISLFVTDGHGTYGTWTMDGTTQYFYTSRLYIGGANNFFYPVELTDGHLTYDNSTYLLQYYNPTMKSDRECSLLIDNSNIDLGDIETITFIREDAESGQPLLATRKQICKKYNIEPTRLKHIDVEDVIRHFQITSEEIEAGTSNNIVNDLEVLETEMNEDLIYMFEDIEYMFEGETPETEIPVTEIKRIVYQVENGTRKEFWHILLPSGNTYHQTEIENFNQAPGTFGSMSKDSILELLMNLEESKIHRLSTISEEAEKNATDDIRWKLGIELTDGTVYSWRRIGYNSTRCKNATYVITHNWDS